MAKKVRRSGKRQPVGPRQKELMLAVFLRNEGAFRQVKMMLQPEHFYRRRDRMLQLTWAAALDYWEQYEELPTWEQLETDLETRLSENDDYLTDEENELLTEFVQYTFSLEDEDVGKVRMALGFARRVLEEASVETLKHSIDGADVAIDLPSLLDEHTKHVQAIQAVDAGRIAPLFGDQSAELPQIIKETTGIGYLDEYMNGGQAAGEVYGVCAPFGVGKTTISVQLCCERIRWEHATRKKAGLSYPPRVIYFAFWEGTKQEMQVRFLTCFARVDKDTIENAGELSSRKKQDYKSYERKMFKGMLSRGVKPPGELERVKHAKKILDEYLAVLDFTGRDAVLREHASQLMPGLASVTMGDQAQRDNPGVSLVVADYAGAAAKQHCEFKGLDQNSHLRHLIGDMPRSMVNNIAAPFNCPCWLMHQLKAQANARAAGVVPHINDSAEAGNFFENTAFGFLIGTKTPNMLAVLTNGKQRRAEKGKDIVVRIDGKLARIVGTGGRYRIDNSRIVSKADYATVADDDEGVDDEQVNARARFTGRHQEDING